MKSKTNSKLKLVKTNDFNLTACGNAIAEDIITINSAESARASLNKHMAEAYIAKVLWGSAKHEGTLGYVVTDALKQRGLSDNVLRVTLCTVKYCFENGIQLDTMTLSRMKERAAKGLVYDLVTGKPRKVTPNGKGKGGKGGKVKTEKTVVHAGIGILKALESEGFVKWLNHLLDAAEIRGVDSTSLDEIKLDLVRDTLKECGYAVQDDKGNWCATVIKESDDEVSEDE